MYNDKKKDYMKNLTWIVVVLLAFVLGSCASEKKVQKSPIKTFVMPCSQLVSSDGVLRAWAVGKSDNENTARKKAQTAAAAELAALLSRTVQATTEEYSTALAGGEQAESRSLLKDKVKVTVSETLQGATIACDQWTHDKATGQYANYLVLELQGEEFMKMLFERLGKNSKVDQELLRKIFLQQIEQVGKEQQ